MISVVLDTRAFMDLSTGIPLAQAIGARSSMCLLFGVRAHMLVAAGLTRSTFFHHQQRLTIADKHAQLKQAICEIFERMKRRYGYRRVHAQPDGKDGRSTISWSIRS